MVDLENISLQESTDESISPDLEVTRCVIQKILVPIIVFVGVTGNVLSVVVLSRKCMKSSTNYYLIALSLFDALYLIFSFTLSLKHYDFFNQSSAYWHWFAIGRVLTDMASNVAVMLTVTFTIERYIGVVHPIAGRSICKPRQATLIVICVVFISIFCTAPEIWELRVSEDSKEFETRALLVETNFSKSYAYQVGFYWFIVIFFTILPLMLLSIFNGLLILTVSRANKLRQRPGKNVNSRLADQHRRDKQKITKMLIMVVLVFLVCQIPGAILLLVRTYSEKMESSISTETNNSILIAGNITNLLTQINASVNFIIYSLISGKFRGVFYRTVCYPQK